MSKDNNSKKTNVIQEKLSIRTSEKHSKNPFIDGAVTEVKGRKKFYNVVASGDRILSKEGEVKPFQGVEHKIVKVVDDAEFVKVFSSGVAGIYDLNSSGRKVFSYLLEVVQENPNVDRIYLHFMDAAEEPWSISKTTFFNGMSELITKNFVAPSDRQNMFYLNPIMIWNGDRFKFITEYIKSSAVDKQKASDERDREALESKGQKRLVI